MHDCLCEYHSHFYNIAVQFATICVIYIQQYYVTHYTLQALLNQNST